MFTSQEHQLVLEVLYKRRAWLLNQIKDPGAEYNQIEHYKSLGKILGAAIEKVQAAAPAIEAKTPTGEDLDFTNLKVLVVEDDRSSTELMREILSDLGTQHIETAGDGNEALTKLFQMEEMVDLVLCDWHMPGKTGVEVYEILKTDTRFRDVIFFLVSSVADGDQIRRAIAKGVNDYVVKPIDENILKRKIINAYNKKFAKKKK